MKIQLRLHTPLSTSSYSARSREYLAIKLSRVQALIHAPPAHHGTYTTRPTKAHITDTSNYLRGNGSEKMVDEKDGSRQ